MDSCNKCGTPNPDCSLHPIKIDDKSALLICNHCLHYYRDALHGEKIMVEKKENLYRYWTLEYEGQTGVLVYPYSGGNLLQKVLLSNKEVINLYPTEFKVI